MTSTTVPEMVPVVLSRDSVDRTSVSVREQKCTWAPSARLWGTF